MLEKSTDSSTARTDRRLGRGAVVAIGAIPVGLLLSGVLVWQSSYAAFNAVADGGSNSWSAGTVAISGDDGADSGGTTGSAMFTPTNLKPGSTGVNCVEVTYGGSLDAAVKLYVKPGGLTGAALAAQLDVVIVEGTGGAFDDCTGFVAGGPATYNGTLSALGAGSTSFATGVGTWTPSSGDKKTYQITYTLKSTAPNSVQGASSSATFTWEAQNT